MKHLIKLISYLTISILISSCDVGHTKDYYIQNELASSIIVKFEIKEVLDSIKIEVNKKELIYSHLYYYGTVGVSDDRFEDVISKLVVQVDTMKRELDESFWQYEKLGKYHANYLMQIDTL